MCTTGLLIQRTLLLLTIYPSAPQSVLVVRQDTSESETDFACSLRVECVKEFNFGVLQPMLLREIFVCGICDHRLGERNRCFIVNLRNSLWLRHLKETEPTDALSHLLKL